ncbi:MAG: hypothetical protein GY804_06530, partial [Alphaproteobacteria bacterium]|nr:hypothetical protein [Alphaproteobacteria bacterium]
PLVAYNAQQLISISPAGWKYHAPTPAGIMNLGITVMDSGGCGIPFPDIPVTLTTELVSFSGSHLHFSAPEAGKGTFSTGTNTTTVITDPFGQATADYTAGVWGVDEELTATLTEPVTNEVKSVVENYSIKIDELRELSTNGPYILKGGKGTRTNCDITHNIDKSTRLGHYVTLFTKAKIWELNALYSSHTGNNLCVNDASLQNGGYFDNGAGGTCHGSHRQGIDVDINTEAELTCLENLKTEYVTYRGNSMTKAKALDRMAASIGGFKVIEDSLHYRFKK